MKFKGVTILEVLVAVLITTIILFISFYGLALVKKNIGVSVCSLKEISGLHTILSRLRSDLWLSDNAKTVNSQLELSVKNNQVEYVFGDSGIIRTQSSIIDTFHIDLFDLKFNDSAWDENNTNDTVSVISFSTVISGDTLPVIIKRSLPRYNGGQ